MWLPSRASLIRARPQNEAARASGPIWTGGFGCSDLIHTSDTYALYVRRGPICLQAFWARPNAMRFSLPAGSAPSSERTSPLSSGLFSRDRVTCETQALKECCEAQHDKVQVGIAGTKSNATFRQERIARQEEHKTLPRDDRSHSLVKRQRFLHRKHVLLLGDQYSKGYACHAVCAPPARQIQVSSR